MVILLIIVFFVAYLAIALEHPLHLDKAVPALFAATIIWAGIAIGFNNGWLSIVDYQGYVFHMEPKETVDQTHAFTANLMHHFGTVSEIIFFLIGAMTIVEIIDLHRGFAIIKKKIRTTDKKKLLWILTSLAFVLSAIIDNLTTTIIIVTLLRKLVPKRDFRVWFAALIIIAANAGGVWSPVGDVTTTMLWINNKVTAGRLVELLILPALVTFLLPVLIASRLKAFSGVTVLKQQVIGEEEVRLLSSRKMLIMGLGMIVFVPVFKAITGLPPYIGMLFSLAVVWLTSEYVTPAKNLSRTEKNLYSTHKALSKIEFSSILFFLGILMAVAGLETMVVTAAGDKEVSTLLYASMALTEEIPIMEMVVIIMGVLSAVIDNVPLVAASMAMFDFQIDDHIWHFIAYCAGTGGSLLVIGSAAGVAAMGMEKIKFMWYLKNIAPLALAGFLGGAIIFLLQVYLT